MSREFKAKEEYRQLHYETLEVLKGLKGESKTVVKEALKKDREEQHKEEINKVGDQ